MDTNTSKKNRILAILITARTRDEWIPRKIFLKIASRGYVCRLLQQFEKDGLVEITGHKGQYRYRATEEASLSSQKEGQLPRAPLRRLKSDERPRGHVVMLRPVSEVLSADESWMEAQRVTFQVDGFTGDAMRSAMNPPTKRDRARQYSMSCGAFSLSISRRNVCQMMIKELQWREALAGFLIGCGLSVQGTESVMNTVMLQMPESIKRIEMPVLDRSVKSREVEFAVVTRVGDDKIVSNINYSTNIDFEVYGNAQWVDNWLAALGAGQHNQVVALVALEEKIRELSKRVNELQKEKEESKEKKDSEDEGGTYYV